jgi:hypothetical protein
MQHNTDILRFGGTMKRPIAFGIACALMTLTVLLATSSAQQDKSARPSPPGTATFKFDDGKTITVNYSRPKARGRKIYGGLVPYGEVWRAGANEATSFVTQADLQVGGTTVPAGSYTLYILPQENGPWKLVVSKKTGQWGIPYPGPQDDLARINMKSIKTPAAVEDFTISFEKQGPNAGVLKFAWENTSASVDFSESNK